MQKSLTQIFNETAEKAHDAFPLAFQAMVIFQPSADAPLYVSPEFAEHLTKNIDSVRKSMRDTGKEMERLNAAGVASPYFPVGGKVAQMIALQDKALGYFTRGYTAEMRAVYVLDHEIGHHVVKNGRGHGPHLAEAAADAYASLRHIQRYGQATEFFDYLNKASMVVLGQSRIHYTRDTMMRVKEFAWEQDISQLSLQETARLAERIAQECHLEQRKLDKIALAFSGAEKIYAEKLGTKNEVVAKTYAQDPAAYELFLRETLKVMQANSDADVQRAAYEFFQYPPMKAFIDNAVATNPEFEHVPATIAAAKKFADIPRVPEPPPPPRKPPTPYFDRG
ncbi:MAG: hypothetical protein K0R10_919 [Alphaproteobacteria bacterium]|jgi:hypothetical protein|nr:hypothetical protein [Alphaproteobacteria bacterium]